ncbi:MAG: hypothetical protein ACP5GH_01035 [Nitrososphaeria archaeon]
MGQPPADEVFKAYDIRGIYGSQIDDQFARRLARSFSVYFGVERMRVAVAYDVRDNSRRLYEVVSDELASEGHEVHKLGLVPTPVFYNYIIRKGLIGGIMVTASHNPPEWVGFKLCGPEATVLGEGSGMERIKEIFAQNPEPIKKEGGKAIVADAEGSYLEFLEEQIKTDLNMNVIVDIGNGSTYSLVPKLCRAYSISCELLFPEPDGRFPNRPSEPTDDSLTVLKRKTREKGVIGAAFDGDGDRLVMVDEYGRTVKGDVLFALLAENYKERENKKAVIEVSFSERIEERLRELGYEVYVSRIGHSFITDLMKKTGALIGGEVSGHYYFKEAKGSDDSIFAFVRVLEILKRLGIRLSDYIDALNLPPSSDIVTVTVPENRKDYVIEKMTEYYVSRARKVITVDGIKAYMEGGWVLVRKSNTMPQIKIKAEGPEYLRLVDEAKRLVSELSRS